MNRHPDWPSSCRKMQDSGHRTPLFSTAELAEAEPLMRRALALDEQSYRAEHPNAAFGLNNLGHLFQEKWRKLPACDELGQEDRKLEAYATG